LKALAEDEAQPRLDNLPARISWTTKEKEERSISEAKPNMTFRKR
jgi:hypothetical protein